MERMKKFFDYLDAHGIRYSYHTHPEAPTIEVARKYWHADGSKHCKNLFFRNHKGDRHYLVVFDCDRTLDIHELEHRLGQGKLSFASEKRMDKYLGLKPGSVSPFGLINDTENHTFLFLDKNLAEFESLSFHPNDNRATVVIARPEFEKFLESCGNGFRYIDLY